MRRRRAPARGRRVRGGGPPPRRARAGPGGTGAGAIFLREPRFENRFSRRRGRGPTHTAGPQGPGEEERSARMNESTNLGAWQEIPPASAPACPPWTPPADAAEVPDEGKDGTAARVDAILSDCGAWGHGGRDLLRPLARQAAELEADLAGRTEHDAEYTRVLSAYEGALKTLRQVARGR